MVKYDWQNKDKFLKDWNLCSRVSDFLKNNDLTLTSGNYKTFKKWFEIHSDNLSDSLSQGNFFTENSTISRVQLRKKIKKMNLLNYICAKCLNNGEWNGKKLVLQLEHKNGIANDNRIENLEYLCPNCHSQTESYAGNNIKKMFIKKRIKDIVELTNKILVKSDIVVLAEKWNIRYYTALKWLNDNYSIIKEHNISLNDMCIKKTIIYVDKSSHKSLEKELLYINNVEKNEFLLNDIKDSIKLSNPVNHLAKIWSIKKFSVKRKIRFLGLSNLHSDFKIEKKNVNNELRYEVVSLMTSKRDVSKSAGVLGITPNALKKWIRLNMNHKFMQIYDEKNLLKNKVIEKKNARISYIKNLSLNFSEEEAMSYLSVNKSGLFSLIKQFNVVLFNQRKDIKMLILNL